MSNRIGAIAVDLAERLDIEPVRALQLFYESKTCADLHDKATGLYLYGDRYIADEFMREKQSLQIVNSKLSARLVRDASSSKASLKK